jgi:hypothetical protein
MPACPDRKRITIRYRAAALIFSDSIGQLQECNENGLHKFEEQHRATELARLHTENARRLLELHLIKHDCWSPTKP